MALSTTLTLQTGLRGSSTILKNSYCNPPLKVVDVTENKIGKELQLMLMSSSPGILDGDVYNQQIHVGEGCHLELTTQSYQRLFQMKRGAMQTMEVDLAPESTFLYLPHPIVPHENAIFSSKCIIHMGAGCSLIWGEVISCGRKLNGEVFKYSSYRSITEIFVKGKLVVKENLWMQPAEVCMSSLGQWEGYTHQASLIYLNEQMDPVAVTKVLIDDLNKQSGMAFGVSALPVNGLIIRLLGYKAEPLFEWIKKVAHILKSNREA